MRDGIIGARQQLLRKPEKKKNSLYRGSRQNLFRISSLYYLSNVRNYDDLTEFDIIDMPQSTIQTCLSYIVLKCMTSRSGNHCLTHTKTQHG